MRRSAFGGIVGESQKSLKVDKWSFWDGAVQMVILPPALLFGHSRAPAQVCELGERVAEQVVVPVGVHLVLASWCWWCRSYSSHELRVAR